MSFFGSCDFALMLLEGSKATDVATEPQGLRHPKPIGYTSGQNMASAMSRWQFDTSVSSCIGLSVVR